MCQPCRPGRIHRPRWSFLAVQRPTVGKIGRRWQTETAPSALRSGQEQVARRRDRPIEIGPSIAPAWRIERTGDRPLKTLQRARERIDAVAADPVAEGVEMATAGKDPRFGMLQPQMTALGEPSTDLRPVPAHCGALVAEEEEIVDVT